MEIIEDKKGTYMSKKASLNKGTSIGYRGDIKFSTYVDKYLLSTKTYKNKGVFPLFYFLANCLAGNFPAAYQSRPFKIKLLKIAPQGADASENAVLPDTVTLPQDLYNTPESQVECSDFINMAAAPEISIQENDKGVVCKVSFSFVFPYARLRRSGANMVALYGPGVSDFTEYSAYYLLSKKVQSLAADGTTETSYEWDPIELPEEEDELNKIFAVEWTMTLSNQN